MILICMYVNIVLVKTETCVLQHYNSRRSVAALSSLHFDNSPAKSCC